MEQLEVGSIVEGKVSGITKFGAFVSLPDGRSGDVGLSLGILAVLHRVPQIGVYLDLIGQLDPIWKKLKKLFHFRWKWYRIKYIIIGGLGGA